MITCFTLAADQEIPCGKGNRRRDTGMGKAAIGHTHSQLNSVRTFTPRFTDAYFIIILQSMPILRCAQSIAFSQQKCVHPSPSQWVLRGPPISPTPNAITLIILGYTKALNQLSNILQSPVISCFRFKYSTNQWTGTRDTPSCILPNTIKTH